MVKAREDQIGPITVLDEDADGYVTATGAVIDNVSGIIHSEQSSSPGNNAIWVESTSPSLPKFTDSDGTTITLGQGGGGGLPEGGVNNQVLGKVEGFDPNYKFNGPRFIWSNTGTDINIGSNDVVQRLALGYSAPSIDLGGRTRSLDGGQTWEYTDNSSFPVIGNLYKTLFIARGATKDWAFFLGTPDGTVGYSEVVDIDNFTIAINGISDTIFPLGDTGPALMYSLFCYAIDTVADVMYFAYEKPNIGAGNGNRYLGIFDLVTGTVTADFPVAASFSSMEIDYSVAKYGDGFRRLILSNRGGNQGLAWRFSVNDLGTPESSQIKPAGPNQPSGITTPFGHVAIDGANNKMYVVATNSNTGLLDFIACSLEPFGTVLYDLPSWGTSNTFSQEIYAVIRDPSSGKIAVFWYDQNDQGPPSGYNVPRITVFEDTGSAINITSTNTFSESDISLYKPGSQQWSLCRGAVIDGKAVFIGNQSSDNVSSSAAFAYTVDFATETYSRLGEFDGVTWRNLDEGDLIWDGNGLNLAKLKGLSFEDDTLNSFSADGVKLSMRSVGNGFEWRTDYGTDSDRTTSSSTLNMNSASDYYYRFYDTTSDTRSRFSVRLSERQKDSGGFTNNTNYEISVSEPVGGAGQNGTPQSPGSFGRSFRILPSEFFDNNSGQFFNREFEIPGVGTQDFYDLNGAGDTARFVWDNFASSWRLVDRNRPLQTVTYTQGVGSNLSPLQLYGSNLLVAVRTLSSDTSTEFRLPPFSTTSSTSGLPEQGDSVCVYDREGECKPSNVIKVKGGIYDIQGVDNDDYITLDHPNAFIKFTFDKVNLRWVISSRSYGASASGLADTLAEGNTTGGSDISMDSGDWITGPAELRLEATTNITINGPSGITLDGGPSIGNSITLQKGSLITAVFSENTDFTNAPDGHVLTKSGSELIYASGSGVTTVDTEDATVSYASILVNGGITPEGGSVSLSTPNIRFSNNDSITLGNITNASVMDNEANSVILGSMDLTAITSLEDSVIIGSEVLNSGTTGAGASVLVGSPMLGAATSAFQSVVLGSNNFSLVGQLRDTYALGRNIAPALTGSTGRYNIMLGIGTLSGVASFDGDSNVLIGKDVGDFEGDSDFNDSIAIGTLSLLRGDQNVHIGAKAGIGTNIGGSLPAGSGNDNVCLGNSAGKFSSTTNGGDRNVFIGYFSGGEGDFNDRVAIGQGSSVNGENAIAIGQNSTAAAGGLAIGSFANAFTDHVVIATNGIGTGYKFSHWAGGRAALGFYATPEDLSNQDAAFSVEVTGDGLSADSHLELRDNLGTSDRSDFVSIHIATLTDGRPFPKFAVKPAGSVVLADRTNTTADINAGANPTPQLFYNGGDENSDREYVAIGVQEIYVDSINGQGSLPNSPENGGLADNFSAKVSNATFMNITQILAGSTSGITLISPRGSTINSSMFVRTKYIRNAGSNDLILENEASAGSAYQIYTLDGNNLTIQPNHVATLFYDDKAGAGAIGGWRVINYY